MMNRHIVKVKAPRAGSSAERLELVLDPNWNPSPDDDDARDDNDNDNSLPYPELTQSWSRHSYHSESTAETDNRSLSKSSMLSSMQRTHSLESDGSYFSRTDFESDALNKEMERRCYHNNNGVSESIDEEDELYYGDVEEDENGLDDSDENKNEYYTNLEKDVSALQSGLMLHEKEEEGMHGEIENPASKSYEEEEDTQQYHVNDDACVIKDVSSPEEEDEYMMLSGGDMMSSATFDDDDQQLQGAMSPESDVYDEVSETTPANNSKTAPPFKRGVSFDEESLSRQESTRSQDRSKTPLRRMPSEDTSVTSVGYRVTTTVKQNIMAPSPPLIIKQRALSPSILREPKYYASGAISVASRGKENTPRRKKLITQEPKSILSPRGTSNNNNNTTALEQPKALSPTNDSIASPDVSVHSHGSNVAVGRGSRQNDQRRQLQQQQQKREAEKQQRRRQLEKNKERLHQQQMEEEQERLLRQKEQEKKQRLQQQQQVEEEQYREPLQSIDPIDREQDDDPWYKYNAIPKLTRSPSGLSRFSEGVRSTVALDGFSRDNKPKIMPKLSWFRSRNKQSVPISAEAARPNGKTKLMKKFFGKKKKGNTAGVDLDDSEMARDSEIGRHPLSPRDPYPEHDQAPLPQILTSDRPMRVHTAGRDWDNESADNHSNSVYSHHSKQSVRSHNSRRSVESSRHDGDPVVIRRKDSQQPKINNETAVKQSKADRLKSNPWSGEANDKTAGSSSIIVHDSTATGSVPTNKSPDGAYNIDGAGMPSFKWWTWSQPDEAGEQKDSRYCAMMCVFPPTADE